MRPKSCVSPAQERPVEGDVLQATESKANPEQPSAFGRAWDVLFWIAIAAFLLGFVLPPEIGDSKVYFWITFALFVAALARIAFVVLNQLKSLTKRNS